MRKETEENLQKIKALYESGASFEKIAEKTGYKESTVKIMLGKAGVSRARRLDKYLPQMIAMRESGASLEEINKATGFSTSSICTHLTKAGCGKYTMHNVGESVVKADSLVYAEDKTAVKPYRYRGKTYTDVTDLFAGR